MIIGMDERRGIYVVLFDEVGSSERKPLGPYRWVRVDSHLLPQAGCRIYDDRGVEVARQGLGWQKIMQDGFPTGRRWAYMKVEAA